METKVFSLEGITGSFKGYTNGETWNGFECPYFELAVALFIMKAYNLSYAEHADDYHLKYIDGSFYEWVVVF